MNFSIEESKENDLIIKAATQGRNEVSFFITDPVFLPEFLIPDPN